MAWSIEGKEVLITGGTSGIGKATAEELARRGADVTITGRDATRGSQAVDDIRDATGVEVAFGLLDLTSLDAVRFFARNFSTSHRRLDVLINNAGTMSGKRRETVDGLEWTFAVNHLGPFLLTNLLADLLVESAPSRIINVSSENHRSVEGGIDLSDLQMTKGYSASKAYAASKLANILFTLELESRLGGMGVTARALHPGVVATSFGSGPEGPRIMRIGMKLAKRFLRTPAEGAHTSVLLATADPAMLAGSIYWSEGKPAEPIPAALDPDVAAALWDKSERLVGLTG